MNHTPELKPCSFCGSRELKDCYVFIQCLQCGAEGPYTNGKRYDDHADFTDHERAIALWNTRADQTGGQDGKRGSKKNGGSGPWVYEWTDSVDDKMLSTLIEWCVQSEKHFEPTSLFEKTIGIIEKALGLPWSEIKKRLGE